MYFFLCNLRMEKGGGGGGCFAFRCNPHIPFCLMQPAYTFFPKERRRTTRTTQQPLLLPEEVKHVAPTDMLGTSNMGRAMELWCEG